MYFFTFLYTFLYLQSILAYQMKIKFLGEIDTKQKIQTLFEYQNPQIIDKLQSEVIARLYEFCLAYENGQSIVFRNEDEIHEMLQKCKHKDNQIENQYKQYKLEIIKNPLVLKIIAKIHRVEQQDWFKKFFDIQRPNIKGRSFSCQMKKQSGGRYSQWKCCLCLNWRTCKIYLLNDGLVTYNQSRQKIQQFMHFGKDFSWEIDTKQQHAVIIHSYHRKLTLKAANADQFFIFLYNLDNFMTEYKKQQMQYRFNSYAPVRYNNHVEFYIDGADYFQALADNIENAQEQIFICGWWISPQFLLKRPCDQGNIDYRLDKLLARTAKKGVKIYIVVYYESSFLTNDSSYTIKALEQLDNNIKVLRHPQIVLPTYWSHHEKLVVIDQSIAFLGGLDICYGRYDTQQHLINQNDPKFYPGIEYNNCRRADFIQVSNYKKQNIERSLPRLPWHDVALMVRGGCVKDLSRHFIQYWNYTSYQTHYADRYVLVSNCNKVVPKKKTGIFEDIIGFANQIKDKMNRNSAQKQKQKIQDINEMRLSQQLSMQESQQRKIPTLPIRQTIGAILSKFRQKEDKKQQTEKDRKRVIKNEPVPQNTNTNKNESQKMKIRQLSPSSELMMISSDKQNQLQNDHIDEDQIQYYITSQQEHQFRRKPCQIENTEQEIIPEEEDLQIVQKRKIQRNQSQLLDTVTQIQKIVTQIQKQEHLQQRVQGDYLQEKPKKIQPPSKKRRNSLQVLTKARESIANMFGGRNRGQQSETNSNLNGNANKQQLNDHNYLDGHTCQALRSASQWSIGSKGQQKSIHEAYLSLIGKAQKFIYIQNQFFISATHNDGVVKNKIMNAIFQRVQRAIKRKETFRVVVIMPLVPGFAGQLDDPSASLPRVIMNWQYKTICRGQQSLLSRISSITSTPQKYIKFFGLRTHGLLNNIPFTQIIYLHSKLMIIDDRYLICGSANINDRSMEGNRDSELCLLVEGTSQKQIIIQNQIFLVVDKIHQVRVKLWNQHFGIGEVQLRNAVDEELWETICCIADVNTCIYRELFGCYPDDLIEDLMGICRFRKQEVSRKAYDESYLKIKGHIVNFPTNFLIKQKLTSYHPNAIST